MRKLRLGIFGRDTSPTEGGADTLLQMIAEKFPSSAGATLELVPVPWSAWSHRRHPFRFLWLKFARLLGSEIPLVDLRAVCRDFQLDLAYFAAPAFARIDIPFVFTLWDLGHRTIPEFPEVRSASDPWTQREAMARRMLAQASYVVVGNETGAAEVCGLYGVDPKRVVPLPFPNPDFSGVTSVAPAWLPARPFFLYPAQLWPHKNHHTLLQALALLAKRGVEADLVFVGSDKGNTAFLKSTAAELGLTGRVHFGGFVPRGELKALYEKAAGLVFPSLLGPNNLPPQEAAVLGCPAILTDSPGHREQLGEGALYVPPLDAEAWASAMARVLSDPGLRAGLAGRAKAAVAAYTLEAYASGLNRLFTEMARRRALWGESPRG